MSVAANPAPHKKRSFEESSEGSDSLDSGLSKRTKTSATADTNAKGKGRADTATPRTSAAPRQSAQSSRSKTPSHAESQDKGAVRSQLQRPVGLPNDPAHTHPNQQNRMPAVIYGVAEPMDDMTFEHQHPVPDGATLEETIELLRLQRQVNTSFQKAQQGAIRSYNGRNDRLQYSIRSAEIQMRLRDAAGNGGQIGNEEQGNDCP